MTTRIFTIGFCTAIVVLALAAPKPAQAQGFISPLLGYDFGGDSGCPTISGCENKTLNIGAGLGSLGSVLGGELEVSYANDFFGKTPGYSSSVLTVMGNLLLAPRIGPVRPYGTGGIGLLKTKVDFTSSSIVDSKNNHLGWDLGAGVMIFPVGHFGVRGDIRHFHAFQDLKPFGLALGNTKLDFGRASGALVFKF